MTRLRTTLHISAGWPSAGCSGLLVISKFKAPPTAIRSDNAFWYREFLSVGQRVLRLLCGLVSNNVHSLSSFNPTYCRGKYSVGAPAHNYGISKYIEAGLLSKKYLTN